MNLLRNCILPMTLGLILAPAAWADDDDKKASDKKGDEQTIRGVVSEVTVLGETDIDFKTRKAISAEATYLTIIGHPWKSEEMKREGAQASNDRDRDLRRTANDDSKSAERPRRRMNVYVVAITPTTKVCQRKEAGKEGSASAKEEACSLDKLEIGDRVEVSFNPRMTPQTSDEKDDTNAYGQKHGRHRTFFGTATAVKILDEPMRDESSASSEKK